MDKYESDEILDEFEAKQAAKRQELIKLVSVIKDTFDGLLYKHGTIEGNLTQEDIKKWNNAIKMINKVLELI
jgi:hypothetical protein